MFKEELLATDGEMLANMKIHAYIMGPRWGGIFNLAWPSPNRPPDPGDRVVVYAVIRREVGVKTKAFSFLTSYFGRKEFCKASLRSTRVCSS